MGPWPLRDAAVATSTCCYLEYEDPYRLILRSVDVQDMTVLDSPSMWVHEKCLPVFQVLCTMYLQDAVT